MKIYRRYAAVLFTALILLVLQGCTAYADNILDNPDFSDLDEENLPLEWYTDAYITEAGYTRFSVAEGDPEHPYALQIQNFGDNDARFAQIVSVEPDTLYCFSGYIRAEGVEGGHGANLSVEGVYAFSEKCYDTGGKWQYIEYYGETGPEQKYITVFARLGGYSGVSTGTAWFAGLSLTVVDDVPQGAKVDYWYREDSYTGDRFDEEDDDAYSAGSFRSWFLVIGLIYTLASLYVLFRFRSRPPRFAFRKNHAAVCTGLILLLGLAVRLFISFLTEGYMVDVNCFLSWGHTFASVGPAGFYEATNFCDYPPLYTYVLGLNSLVSDMVGGGEAADRIVFRFIPSVCDLAACWMIYRLLLKQEKLHPFICTLVLLFMSLNPATILNSAAWGQMDSVLCLLLLATALTAISGKWACALPLYVTAVLVKPQALMLGPLGLAYIILTYIRDNRTRRSILYGTGISLAVLAAGVIPFSLRQNWDWLIQLYMRTLGSYPYATVNTANLYYLLGGNWSAVEGEAHVLAPVLLGCFCIIFGSWWYLRARMLRAYKVECVICLIFTAAFTACAFVHASWAWVGGLFMAFSFVIVLSPAVRSGDIRLLAYLGGLLYILLFVFGVKMHERYVFPALLLLAAAWVLLRDRRILYVAMLFTLTLFINEGIVLDNSIRLGSKLGHLNSDTVWLADIVSVLNIAGSVYAVWLCHELWIPGSTSRAKEGRAHSPLEWHTDRSLHWKAADTVLVITVTAVYAAISLLTLGSAKAPQTCWSSSTADEKVVFDLGEHRNSFEILYFGQVSMNDFSVSVSEDGIQWKEETWAQMDQGQCWKWKYVTVSVNNGSEDRTYYNSDESNIVRFSGRYIRLSAMQLGLKLNEILFRDESGNVLSVKIHERTGAAADSELYSDPTALIDEQDTLEGLPAFPGSEKAAEEKIQPSWWNSTYFDEIYHARTAHEFVQGTKAYETSHPPLGKVLMSFAVSVFGMTPFGWRFAGALAGILMLPGMYLLGKQLTKKTLIAAAACLMMTLDCQHLTQSQIATIDSFPVLFIIFAYFFMLRFVQTDILHDRMIRCVLPLCFSGLFMGLSIASKWIGIYAGAGLAVLFFWHCIRMLRIQKAAVRLTDSADLTENERNTLIAIMHDRKGSTSSFYVICGLCLWCILFFVIIPAAIYLISYIPYMVPYSGRIRSLSDYINEVWRAQIGMFDYHSTPGLGMDHPFYSPWWEWPVIGKPMYYASESYIPSDAPLHHSIFCFGNPVIWFGALGALCLCVIRILQTRRYSLEGSDYVWHLRSTTWDVRYAFVMIGLLAQYLPWVLVPRGTYIYHYFASLPFLMLSIGLCFDSGKERTGRAAAAFTFLFLTAAAVFFVILFPYASGLNVSAEWLDIGSRILRIWY